MNKILIIITYIIIFTILCFIDRAIINYIVNLLQNPDIKLIVELMLSFFTIGPVILLTITIGGMITYTFRK